MAEEVEADETKKKVGNESEALTFNQEIVEMLQLLDYEAKFCDKELQPISSMYFVYPASNQAQQFKYFASLVAWLLGLCDAQPTWKKYDNPNTICTNMLVALKDFGVSADLAPSKLKNGYGDGVCNVLHELVKQVFTKLEASGKWAWGPPNWPDEALFDEADVDSDAEVGEVEDVMGQQQDDEEEMMYAEILGGNEQHAKHDEETWFVESKIDPREWQLELERITPKLRVQVQGDTNEWRHHITQTNQYSKSLMEQMPQTTAQLATLGEDLAQILQRLRAKEGYINSQFDSRGADYRTRQRELEEVNQKYQQLNESHMNLLEELRASTEEYESLKAEMADRSQTVQDTAPLVKIKDARNKLKADICQMDLRIGVVHHTLMQAKLRQRPSDKAQVGRDWIGEEDD
jgi:estrogen-related receptor beta like 1